MFWIGFSGWWSPELANHPGLYLKLHSLKPQSLEKITCCLVMKSIVCDIYFLSQSRICVPVSDLISGRLGDGIKKLLGVKTGERC